MDAIRQSAAAPPVDVWTKVAWTKEACDLSPDPVSGAAITRLNNSPLPTNNNYVPAACSSDGRRIAAVRWLDPLLSPINALLALDLDTKWTAVLDPNLASCHVLPDPFTGRCYYVNREQELCRLSLDTFAKEVLTSLRGMPPVADLPRGVTPDQSCLFYTTQLAISGGQSMAIVRVDLHAHCWRIIYENPGLTGFSYLHGANQLLVGRRLMPDGSTPPIGAWKNAVGVRADGLLMDLEGRVLGKLGPARGYTYYHPDTGQVVCNCYYDTSRWEQLPDRPQGNMVVFDSLDWTNPRVIEAPTHLFMHIAGSRCGRYVVSEATRRGLGPFGPTDIVVVNWQSGKSAVVVSDCGSRGCGGGNASWQPTPYLTSDNSHVVYNADPHGLLGVYAARLPEGFLAALA